MIQGDKRARLWFYCSDLSSSESLPSSGQGSKIGGPTALKHWAVKLDYMSIKHPGKVNKSILYEANNKAGLLVARIVMFAEDEDEEWRQRSGFIMEDHGLVTINESRAEAYCEGFNKLKIKYVATRDNCQRFVDDFIANLLPDTAISLPTTIKEVKYFFDSASSTVLNSLSNGSASVIKNFIISSRIGKGMIEEIVKETIKHIDLNGFGSISKLPESPIKEYMAKEGKSLVLTAFGEMTENMLNLSRGAFTWWNLLQIPVELIMGKLLKSQGFTDLQAYGGKKLASCLTAAGVGFAAGSPLGCVGALGFWIVAEVVATFSRILLVKIFPQTFGESETLELIKSIYRYFAIKMSGELNASLQWMVDYPRKTKKLA